MKKIVSCEFSDFNTAELAMRAISKIDTNNITMSLSQKKRYLKKGKKTFPVLPSDGAMPSPFSAVASSTENEREFLEPYYRKECNLLVSINNDILLKRVNNIINNYGGINVKEIKY